VERGFAPLGFESRMIPPVIIDPQAEEERGQPAAVNHGSGGGIKHAQKLARTQRMRKREKRSDGSIDRPQKKRRGGPRRFPA
jgi:hypothetical protein